MTVCNADCSVSAAVFNLHEGQNDISLVVK